MSKKQDGGIFKVYILKCCTAVDAFCGIKGLLNALQPYKVAMTEFVGPQNVC